MNLKDEFERMEIEKIFVVELVLYGIKNKKLNSKHQVN